MLNPIEKPTADELRAAEIVFQSVTDAMRVIRAVVRSDQRYPKERTGERITRAEAIRRGYCIIPDFVFEMHIPRDGSPVTWWAVYDSNPALSL